MPRIIVQSDPAERSGSAVTLLETVVPSQIECEHFSNHLIQRLRWAVTDATRLDGGSAAAS